MPIDNTQTATKMTFSNIGTKNITTTNAMPYCAVSYTGSRPSAVGLFLGESASGMREVTKNNINHNATKFNASYDIINEAKQTLKANTTYYFKFYAIVNGSYEFSSTNSFTTLPDKTLPTTIPVSSISLNAGDICIDSGATLLLAAVVTPSNATNKTVTWSSSNTAVATVSSNGLVTGKAAGKTVITATADGKTAKINIEVLSVTHTHSFTKNPASYVEALHPHKEYETCKTCGETRYTGDYATVPSCSQCVVKTAAPTVNTSSAKSITQTNAVIYGSVSKQNGVNIGQCGFYLGRSSGNMSKIVSFTASAGANSKNSGTGFDIWCDISDEASMSLLPGTTYYYQCFAEYNGVEYKGSVQSFTTEKKVEQPAVAAPTVYTSSAKSVTQTNAVIYGSVSKQNGVNIGQCGFYFGTSSSNMSRAVSFAASAGANSKGGGTGFDIWCDMNAEAGMWLTPGTTYYYQCFAEYNGVEYKGSVQSFTTEKKAEPVAATPTVYTSSAKSITSSNAVIYGSVSKQNGMNIGQCGFYLGTSSGNMSKVVSFTASAGANSKGGGTGFDIWCDMNAEAGMWLTPGTTYYYQCFAEYNGVEYKGVVQSFTTK